MNSKFVQSGYIGLLTIDGEITAGHYDKLKLLLIRALQDSDYIILNLTGMTRIDPACNDLICSTFEVAMMVKKKMKLINSQLEKLYCKFDFANNGADRQPVGRMEF